MFIGCTLPSTPIITTLYTAFEAIYPPNFYFAGEAHDFMEIVCVLDGTAEITANDRILTLEKNQAILHPPLEFHRIRNATQAPLQVLTFSFAANDSLNESTVIVLTEPLRARLQEWLALAKETFLYAEDGISVCAIQPQKEESAKRVKNRLQSILLEFLRTKAYTPAVNSSKQAQNYAHILQICKQHLACQLTTQELSRLCHMSPSALKKTVHDFSGMGVITLFHELKLQTACNLLREGRGIQEISFSLGFDNPNYFCTFFKRKFGIPPTKWRNSHLGKDL